MAILIVLQGPAGAGKSQLAAELLAAGEIDILADVTSLWASLGAKERGADGLYPIRKADDPALHMARYTKEVAARKALEEGHNVAITTSSRGQLRRFSQIASETDSGLDVRTVDPGESVVRDRLADQKGKLSDECKQAISRWYGRPS